MGIKNFFSPLISAPPPIKSIKSVRNKEKQSPDKQHPFFASEKTSNEPDVLDLVQTTAFVFSYKIFKTFKNLLETPMVFNLQSNEYLSLNL